MEVCSEDGEYGVYFSPSGSMQSGVNKSVTLQGTDDVVSARAYVYVDAAGSQVGVRLVFRDGAGTIVSTLPTSYVLGTGWHWVSALATKPTGAASVDVQVVGLSDITRFWLNDLVFDASAATPAGDENDCYSNAETQAAAYEVMCDDLCDTLGGTERNSYSCTPCWDPILLTCEIGCEGECKCVLDPQSPPAFESCSSR